MMKKIVGDKNFTRSGGPLWQECLVLSFPVHIRNKQELVIDVVEIGYFAD